jgi:selenide,water dikinase
MGGNPVLALNIMMFPAGRLPMEAYSEILRGGFEKAMEAGVKIIGGHTIDDAVPKYGLAVTGFVNPSHLVTNAGARPGDCLILTKPVGTGIIMAGHRLGMASDADLEEAKLWMKMLNRSGAAIMKGHGVTGATDITGFGLAGHAIKMARASKVSISINMRNVPLTGKTLSLADEGCLPGACFTNLEYCENVTDFSDNLDYSLKMIAFDAQTSGGLLISAPAGAADHMIAELKEAGLTSAAIIGKVSSYNGKLLYLDN